MKLTMKNHLQILHALTKSICGITILVFTLSGCQKKQALFIPFSMKKNSHINLIDGADKIVTSVNKLGGPEYLFVVSNNGSYRISSKSEYSIPTSILLKDFSKYSWKKDLQLISDRHAVRKEIEDTYHIYICEIDSVKRAVVLTKGNFLEKDILID